MEKINMENKFNIVRHRKLFLAIPAVIIVIGLIFLILHGGFNMDIDFVGGTTIHINLNKTLESGDISEINAIVSSVTGEGASYIQSAGDARSEVILKTKEITTEQRDEIFKQMKEKYSLTDADRLAVDNVSSAVGKDLQRSAVISTLLAVVLMLVYITFRFELRSGIAAVMALLHDVFVILSLYAIFDISMNLTFIAAILTILGYSINATIIIFDRVREEARFQTKEDFAVIVNRSIWRTLGRSMNTSLTTLFTIAALFIVGVPSIRAFALPIIIGIVCGTYSSVFLSGTFWYLLRGKKQAVK